MAVIYLKHPRHGQKVASSEMEAAEDRKNGWEDFDPSAPVDASEPSENLYTPEYVAELVERAEKAEGQVAELKVELKEVKAELKKAEAALKKAEKAPSTPPGTVPDFLKPEG